MKLLHIKNIDYFVIIIWHKKEEEIVMFVTEAGGSLEKIFSTTGVQYPKTKGSMFKNERYSFQVAFQSRWTGVEGLKIEIYSLLKRISYRVVEYANSKYTLPEKCDEYYLTNRNRALGIPDILKPFGEMDLFLRAHLWTSVWFTIDGEDEPGVYPIIIRLVDPNDERVLSETQYTIEVIDEELPRCDLPISQHIQFESICAYHHVSPYSKAFFDLLTKYLASYVQHGNNTLWLSLNDSLFSMDEAQARQIGELALKNGVRGFELHSAQSADGRLLSLQSYLRAKGAEWVHIRCNRNEILTERGECIAIRGIHDYIATKKACLTYDENDTDRCVTNRFLGMPLQRLRVLGIQMYINEVLGFYHEKFNDYYDGTGSVPINPHHDTDGKGYYPSGHAFLVYPSYPNASSIVYDSVRLEVFNDALQDYRALKLLEKYQSREKVLRYLNEKGYYGFSIYPTHPDMHLWIREEINIMLKEEASNGKKKERE